MHLLDELLDAWRLHNEVHLYVLAWVPPAGLEATTLLKTGKPSTGRNVARIFSHLHEVRCDKLARNLPEARQIVRFEGSEVADSERLAAALTASGSMVAELVRRSVLEERPIKGWKRSPLHWITYLIAHESHHRGQIAQALKQSGVRPPQEVSYGVWGYLGGYSLPPLPT